MQCMDHTGFFLAHGCHVLFQSTLLSLQVALQGICPAKRALHFVHSPGLSCSGSGPQVVHKSTDSVGCVFCTLPRSEQFRRPGAWRAHSPQVCGVSYHLSGPSLLVSWVCGRSTVSSVLFVSSGELISGCDPPGGRPLSRVPGRKTWLATGSLQQFGRGCRLWGRDCPFPALAATRLPPCLRRGMGRFPDG